MKKDRILKHFIILLAVFFFLPALGWAQCTVTDITNNPTTCTGSTISYVISCAKKGDTIQISGTCLENVIVTVGDLTFEGTGSSPTVTATSAAPVFLVTGKGATISGLTITGGTIGTMGIYVGNGGYAAIINNTISGNSDAGVVVMENASAHIGFSTYFDTTAQPNTITENGTGIIVRNTSSAAIIGNNIISNTYNGILVERLSQADIADNIIGGNGLNGIAVTGNSGVNLAESTLVGIYATPNSTDGNSENKFFGLACLAGGYVSGYLGSLDGTKGDRTIDATCINSLAPSPYKIVGSWKTSCPQEVSNSCPTQVTIYSNGTGIAKGVKPPGGFTWNLAGLELTVISKQTMYGPINWTDKNDFTWTFEIVGQSGTTTMFFVRK